MTKQIFFSSDHHFGHANIIKYCKRPFSHLNEMDKEMARRWNEVVKPEDTVYYLGDFSLQFRAAAWWVPQLNGNKIAICGNHDSCHPYKKNYKEYVQKYLDIGFLSVVTEMKLKIPLKGKETIVKLHHLPYQGPSENDKYLKYRPIKEDEEYLFCGHIHNAWKRIGNTINVGVDAFDFYPASITDIERRLAEPESKPGGLYNNEL